MASLSNPFFERPIVNSPYEFPRRHWELVDGQPTGTLIDTRRRAEFITPIPKPKKRKASPKQEELLLDEGRGLTTKKQAYDLTSVINEVRSQVDTWRNLPASQWQVTPETGRLLQHWRHHEFGGVRPFFCQIEAVETAIWFTEVAPHLASGKRLIDNLETVNGEANPNIERLALKLATGAGKTTVMAMLIAWQTLNAVRRPGSKRPRTRAKELMRRGLDATRARQSASNGHGPWWNAGASHMHAAVPTAVLHGWGLLSLLDEHRRLRGAL